MNKYFYLPSWVNISIFFLLASLGTFFFKKPTLFFYNTNINDLLLLLSLISFGIAVIKKEIIINIPLKIVTIFGIGTGTLLLGTIISCGMTGTIAPDALREYARIIASLLIFFEIVIIAGQDVHFMKKALLALTCSTALLPIVFYLPPEILSFFLDESKTRFTGFLYDPNYFAALQILPTFILLWVSLGQSFAKNYWIQGVGFFFFLFSFSSIIWSGSRGGILGLIIGIIFLLSILFIKLKFRKAITLSLVILLGCFISFPLLPQIARSNITNRLGSLAAPETDQRILDTLTHERISKYPTLVTFTAKQDRGIIWINAIKEIIKNPFGYGPGYGNSADIIGSINDHHRVAHNTLLQIILTGGFVLLGLILYGIYILWRTVIIMKIPFGVLWYLMATGVALFISGIFLDSLWSRWIWITLALIISLINNYSQKNKLSL